ncbi:MAG TPA: hypothetical protein VGP63_01815 [Planctomycetaceae bacterium]|jgi:hypothetical protein|nr:hypothetical protein [Planctomycetaceae bacterium]
MSPDVAAWILAAILVLSVGALIWFLLKSVRTHNASYRETLDLNRRAIEASEAAIKVTVEANATMRELITEMRASRQAPQPPTTTEKTSN